MVDRLDVKKIVAAESGRRQSPFMIIAIVFVSISFGFWTLVVKNSADPDFYEFMTVICVAMMATGFLAGASGSASVRKKAKIYEAALTSYVQNTQGVPIPEGFLNIECFTPDQGTFRFDRINYLFWNNGNELVFHPARPTMDNSVNFFQVRIVRLQADAIRNFSVTGDQFYENKISGGGSTGANIGGAIIGEAIGGTVGAIVGGQAKIDPIKSELVLHDTRMTVIQYALPNQITTLSFGFNLFDWLNRYYPTKNKDIIDAIQRESLLSAGRNETPKTLSGESDAILKIKKLQQLRDNGMIDEKEFQERKNKILDNL